MRGVSSASSTRRLSTATSGRLGVGVGLGLGRLASFFKADGPPRAAPRSAEGPPPSAPSACPRRGSSV